MRVVTNRQTVRFDSTQKAIGIFMTCEEKRSNSEMTQQIFTRRIINSAADFGERLTYIRDLRTGNRVLQLLNEFQRSAIDDLRMLIEEGIAAGTFQPVNSRLAAELLDAAASRIQNPRVLAETNLTLGRALADVITVITGGLLRAPH